jgi:hypothetical protein
MIFVGVFKKKNKVIKYDDILTGELFSNGIILSLANSKKILIVVTIILTISVVLKTGLFSGHSKILDSPVIATTPNTLKNYKYTSKIFIRNKGNY